MSFIVSIESPDGDTDRPHYTVIATEEQVEDLKTAAQYAGCEVSVYQPSSVGSALQWMAGLPRRN